jgi:hypothetical protein
MAAEQQLVCQRHGRPAVAQRIRRLPDGTEQVEYLCEIDLAEERMSRPFGGGGSLFDNFFSDFFADSPTGRLGTPERQRQVDRVDITEFFSDATRQLLQRAAQTALERTTSTPTTSSTRRCRTRSSVTSYSRSTRTPMRSPPRSRRTPTRASGPMSRHR